MIRNILIIILMAGMLITLHVGEKIGNHQGFERGYLQAVADLHVGE